MIFSDKRFIKYCVACMVYILILTIFNYGLNQGDNVFFWCTDMFFVFQFSLMLLVGCGIIDTYFSSYSYVRYNHKKQVILQHWLYYTVWGIFLDSVLFLETICFMLVLDKEPNVLNLLYLLELTGRFLLGTLVINTTTTFLRYFPTKKFGSKVHMLVYISQIVEVLVIAPEINQWFSGKTYIFFSWIFAERFIMVLVFSIMVNLVLYSILFNKVKEMDMIS